MATDEKTIVKPVDEGNWRPSYRFMGFIKPFEKEGFRFVKNAGPRRHVMTCKIA